MKIYLFILILFFTFSSNIYSQKKKNNKNEFVKSTSSVIRVADYEKRLELERNSIAKNTKGEVTKYELKAIVNITLKFAD